MSASQWVVVCLEGLNVIMCQSEQECLDYNPLSYTAAQTELLGEKKKNYVEMPLEF